MQELLIVVEDGETISEATTMEELDALFEVNMRVNNVNILFAANKGETGRNEDKAPYFKVYIGITSSAKIDDDTEMYRIMYNEPVYTAHTGGGYTPKKMGGKTKKLIKKALMSETEYNGQKVFGYEKLYGMGSDEFGATYLKDKIRKRPEQQEDETDKDFKEREKKELAQIKKDVEKDVDFLLDNMKYDGKR